MIDRARPMPPYLQLAAILREKIASGELAPGARLPSVLGLAAEYHVAQATAQKALALLKGEGLIIAYAGYGTFISEDAGQQH